jgi:hypothetical protein
MVENQMSTNCHSKRNSIFDKSLGRRKTYHQNYDIASDDVLTYKEMLQQYAEVRRLKGGFIPFLL